MAETAGIGVRVVEFVLGPGGMLMVAAIGGDGGSSVSFVEWACPFISDKSASIVETALACNLSG